MDASQIQAVVKGWIARSTFLPILLLAISKSYCVCRFCHSCALVSEVPGQPQCHLSRKSPVDVALSH